MLILEVAAGIILGLGVVFIVLHLQDVRRDYLRYKDNAEHFEKRYYEVLGDKNELKDKLKRYEG